MRWHRNIRLSLRAISRSWLRTTLSVSGVAVGIGSVVVLIGAGNGAERALREALQELGRNLLVVNAAATETSALRGTSRLSTTLTLDDWKAISREVPDLLQVAPIAERQMLAQARGRAVSVRITGTTPGFGTARNFPVVAGRFIEDEDLSELSRVAVVGPLVVKSLFAGESPLGEQILVQGVPFRVIGVMKKKGVSLEGSNEDELVILPLSTAMRRLLNEESLARIFVQAASEEALPSVRLAIEALLRWRHALAPGTPGDFRVLDQTALLRSQQQVGGSLSRTILGLSGLALGLGGVGLLAVSLLAVRERFAEIGLRLAVGGLPRDIMLQFLTEAVMISIMGGVAGLAVGSLGILAGSWLTSWSMVLSWQAAVYPLAISIAIAMIFGSYPALRAARLDPIVALNSR